MDRARSAFSIVRDVVGVLGIVLIPLVAWAWRGQEQRTDEARLEAITARRELAEFQKWHADTMVRRDYLDARFGQVESQLDARFSQVEAQVAALRDELRASRRAGK